MKHLPHLATRIFDTPLLIAPQKLEVILSVLQPRFTGEISAAAVSGEHPVRKPYEVTPEGIAVIPMEGTLVHKAYGLDALSGLRSYVELQQEVEEAAADPNVAGILLDVDSPGGEVAGAFDLADAIFNARSAKPVVAVANNDAFSAAYLLASAADRLYVSRTSGVGSIGVIVSHVDVSASDERLGYKYTIIHAGARKADFNSHAPLSDEARDVLAAAVERTYGLLVTSVARNRGAAESAIRGTEAGLFFGADAVAARLADSLGTRQDALNELKAQLKPRAASIRAALSAPTSQKQEIPMDEATKPAEQPQPVIDLGSLRAEARREGYAEAREIVELCTLAGMPAKAAGLLAQQATAAEARRVLMEARVAEAGPEIRSHVMPDTGTSAPASLDNNPVVKAVENLAAAAKGGR